MNDDLNSVGMKKGQHYETIITTEDEKGAKNAAPIGIICKKKDQIICKIFEGSATLNNITKKQSFTVNITINPILFTLATIGNPSKDYFTEDKDLAILKDVDAYIKCEVIAIKKGIKHNDPVRKTEAGIITAKVKDIIKNKECVKAPNRGFYSLIEALVNFTRIDIVNKKQQEYFLDRFKESKRIVKKVGSKEDKESIELLESKLKEKGYSIK